MISLKNILRFFIHNGAVSPVIGEILMVAIVVILAVIIGSFAFGLGGNVQDTYTVGVIAEQTGADKITVTFHGGEDADKVLYLNVSVNGVYSDGDAVWDPNNPLNSFDGNGIDTIDVGTSRYLTDDPSDDYITVEKDHVVVVGKFIGGQEQIVLDAFV
jgi:FlaG/FlaF family flagellin (archaellin)